MSLFLHDIYSLMYRQFSSLRVARTLGRICGLPTTSGSSSILRIEWPGFVQSITYTWRVRMINDVLSSKAISRLLVYGWSTVFRHRDTYTAVIAATTQNMSMGSATSGA